MLIPILARALFALDAYRCARRPDARKITQLVFDAVSPVHSYYIPAGNMEPTIHHGDKQQLVSRIVAEGGDEVEIRQGSLYLNGQRQEEAYVTEPAKDAFKPFRVPPNEFFMLGDNRNNSFDSRYWRSVPSQNLKGRVMRILSSRVDGRAGQAP